MNSERESLIEARDRLETTDFVTLEREVGKHADELLDAFIVAMQDFDTATLLGIAEYRDRIHPDGWMQRLIREYLSVWRQGS